MPQLLSFKQTILFKRGILLSTAALMAFSILPSIADGSFSENALPPLAALCVVGLFCGYLLWKLQIHRLADSVIDFEDHLKVRRRKIEQSIPFSDVLSTEVSSSLGFSRIIVRLKSGTRLGSQLEFLPQASLWSNVAAVQRLADGLMDRARQPGR
jgi:hypothetical protein